MTGVDVCIWDRKKCGIGALLHGELAYSTNDGRNFSRLGQLPTAQPWAVSHHTIFENIGPAVGQVGTMTVLLDWQKMCRLSLVDGSIMRDVISLSLSLSHLVSLSLSLSLSLSVYLSDGVLLVKMCCCSRWQIYPTALRVQDDGNMCASHLVAHAGSSS